MASGLIGAAVLTGLHELLRKTVPDAPRLDLAASRAISKAIFAMGGRPPAGEVLYGAALAGDLGSNAAYYSLVGMGSNPLVTGAVLGVAAGVGAVVLPEQVGLGQAPTRRTPQTALMTAALYTAGGIAAGAAYRAMKR
jgi:hypothetical protein